MKNLIKDRKTLSLVLCLVLVSVFTLTIAYSALSAVLTINGNARVSAADWDIYLNNPRVTNGSATTNVPEIKTSSTLEFSTILNMPGDFYEFTVDVVNGGDIDAMIENVVKTPDLTVEQAKFLKYEVSYQNDEAITTKQLLAKDTTMPIKVRIEYRKDLSNSDLPTGQVVLDLALTLEYIQSDGTGSSVNNNGVYDLYKIGNEKCFGSECFYVINSDIETVTLLAKNNLDDTKNIQSSSAPVYYYFTYNYYWLDDNNILKSEYGLTFPAYVYDANSCLYNSLINYSNYLSGLGISVYDVRLIKYEELESLGCSYEEETCVNAPQWIYSENYWGGSAVNDGISNGIIHVSNDGFFNGQMYLDGDNYESGIRPVIVISKDYFN